MTDFLQIPKIDFHTHFFPAPVMRAMWNWFEKTASWDLPYKQGAEQMIETLKTINTKHAVLLHFAHKVGLASSFNRFAHELSVSSHGFLLPFGTVHPDDDNKEQILTEAFGYGFKGVKLHCHVQKVAADDPRLDEVYQICSDHQKIMLIHCGSEPHFVGHPHGYGYDVREVSGVASFLKVIKRFPKLTFVVPHFGYGDAKEFVDLLEEFPNLYLDTSFTLNKVFEIAPDRQWFIDYSDRLLYGTDFPLLPHTIGVESKALCELNLGELVEQKIFYTNAAKLLGIS